MRNLKFEVGSCILYIIYCILYIVYCILALSVYLYNCLIDNIYNIYNTY